jgi:hypothetical protein
MPQHVGWALSSKPAAAAGFPALVVQPSLESRGDQLGDAVTSEDDGGEASCNDGEKKRGS